MPINLDESLAERADASNSLLLVVDVARPGIPRLDVSPFLPVFPGAVDKEVRFARKVERAVWRSVMVGLGVFMGWRMF